MNNLFIVPIEKIESRYSKHWFDFLPEQLARYTNKNVVQITLPEGDSAPENTEGGFFNFGFTCAYKSKQLIEIEKMFDEKVKNGDIFLFTDYWNPAVVFLRYISAMKGVNIKIVGICHAGLWDPADMLSRSFGNTEWGRSLEKTLYHAYDHLLFATGFSRSLFGSAHYYGKTEVTGFPMEYYDKILPNYWDLENPPKKTNTVVFPHRKAPEKKIDLFYALKEEVQLTHPDIEFVVALDECKTKDQYHDLLYRSKVAFSAATQETLGISMGIEAPICGCIPLVPNRLSYAELFYSTPKLFIKEETVSSLSRQIIEMVENYDSYLPHVKIHRELARNWFDGYKFYSFFNNI